MLQLAGQRECYGRAVAPRLDDSDEAEALPKNPALREVVPAQPSDRTAMIDREAIEAKREQRRAQEAARNPPADPIDEDKTPPPQLGHDHDPDATGTASPRKKKRRTTEQSRIVRTEEAGATAHVETGGADADADEDKAVHPLPAPQDRPTRPKKKMKPLSPAAAGALVVIGLCVVIGGVVVAVRSTGVLTVTTVPHGAAVTLDGAPIGTTPVQKRVGTGNHVVELALEGFEPFREVVDVPADGLPFLQPLKALPPPPAPPPTPDEIADELAAQARRLLTAGELDSALGKVEELERVKLDHKGSAGIRAEVRAAVVKRDTDLARVAAGQRKAAQLQRARQLAADGKRLYEDGKLGPAREKLYESLRLDPSYPDPHRTLAKLFNRDDQLDKVRYHLERFLALGGSDPDFKVREWLKTHPK